MINDDSRTTNFKTYSIYTTYSNLFVHLCLFIFLLRRAINYFYLDFSIFWTHDLCS